MGCRWMEAILAVLIVIFTWWPTQIVSMMVSKWIVVVSAVLLLVHALFCDKCKGLCRGMIGSSRTSSRSRRR